MPIDEAEAEARVKGICFKTGPPRRVGVELEWLLHDERRPWRRVGAERLRAAHEDLAGLALTGALTQEPGGQLELSSAPAESLTACVESTSADLVAVRERLLRHRLRPVGLGHEPTLRPKRVLRLPRYAAMEQYFDRGGPAGRSMMCGTASVQVCLDAGTADPRRADGYRARWRLAHLLGPVLVAAFANSPFRAGRPTGFRSTRQVVWALVDPARTSAPGDDGDADADPRLIWARYALDAPVLCIRGGTGVRAGPGEDWQVPADLTFRAWIRDRGRRCVRPPTADDLAYHLTTLFPPVRPRGHLELRMIDAQPGDDGWIVPLAVTTALLDDPVAAEAARATLETLGQRAYHNAPSNPLWHRAARDSLGDTELRRVTRACFAAAEDALPRLGASSSIRDAVAAFRDRYVVRGRCPADDLLDPGSRYVAWAGLARDPRPAQTVAEPVTAPVPVSAAVRKHPCLAERTVGDDRLR